MRRRHRTHPWTAAAALLATLSFLTACDDATGPEMHEVSVELANGLVLDVTVSRDSIVPFDTVFIRSRLTNPLDYQVTTNFTTGCPLFVEVVNTDGTSVTFPRECSDHPATVTLDPGARWVQELEWTAENLMSQAPLPVGLPAGVYRAYGVLEHSGLEIRTGARQVVVYYPPD